MSANMDFAEAVSKGLILVDEIDVIDALKKGLISETEGAHFSALMENYASKKYECDGVSECVEEIVDTVSKRTPMEGDIVDEEGKRTTKEIEIPEAAAEPLKCENILVDEIDFLEAVKQGKIDRSDSHIISIYDEDDERFSYFQNDTNGEENVTEATPEDLSDDSADILI